MKRLGLDLERIVPERMDASDPLDAMTLAVHRKRYHWAARLAPGRRVLDMACGVGYGTMILVEAGASTVLGVDIDPAAVAHARATYRHPRLEFVEGDAATFGDGPRFDLVVSLETIEHVSSPSLLIRHLSSLVGPDGWLVCSVPVTVSTDANPYHLHDFTEGELLGHLSDVGLEPVDTLLQVQAYSPFGVLAGRRGERRRVAPTRRVLSHYLRHPETAVRRIAETLKWGFCNRYLVVAARRSVR